MPVKGGSWFNHAISMYENTKERRYLIREAPLNIFRHDLLNAVLFVILPRILYIIQKHLVANNLINNSIPLFNAYSGICRSLT